MQTKRRDLFTTVRTEGAILPADLLQRIADGDRNLEGLKPEDFHRSGERLNEVINGAWNRLLGQWQSLQTALSKLPESDPATSVTRERWLLPLFRELDYGRLSATPAIEIEGKSYPISHGWQTAPIHLVGWRIEMDRRTAGVAGAAKTSPHSLVQELLNRSPERLWGFVSNGRRLRILRDNISLTRQAFVEFDLEAMMDGEVYADFALLWLLCHQSRVEAIGEGNRESGVGSRDKKTPSPPTPYSPLPTPPSSSPTPDSRFPTPSPSSCWLEKWSRTAQETGTRALDSLRQGVEDAITALGRGFLAHPENRTLRDKLYSGNLPAQEYYRQVLRLVYRLLFLFVAEDRGLLLLPSADEKTREKYARYYSTARLRHLAERHRGTRHCDLYQGLAVVMQKLGAPGGCPELGLPALGSFLWSDRAMPDLTGSREKAEGNRESGVGNRAKTPSSPTPYSPLPTPPSSSPTPDSRFPTPYSCKIANSDLLDAVRVLAFTVDGNVLRGVDYKNLGAEELGSVYESLLELHPKINADAATFALDVAAGHERKTTGSYYTHTSLVNCLLDSALDPVLDEAVRGTGSSESGVAGGNRESGVRNREKKGHSSAPPIPDSQLPTPSSSPPTPDSQLPTASPSSSSPTAYCLLPTPSPPPSTPESRILALKVGDPACGSGHFLIAAAHRIAKRLAAVRTGDEEPAPEAYRQALRDVIGHCIYGVDINPMAVELCKINPWLESLEPGRPLSFLDHHIQCGNSLLGATPALLKKGIPDEAFTPIEGDDKKLCAEYKKINRDERRGQKMLFDGAGRPWERMGDFAVSLANLDMIDDDSLEAVRSKEERYAELVGSADYLSGRFWADTWCAAFVWKKTRPSSPIADCPLPTASPSPSSSPTPDSRLPTPPSSFDYPITEDVFRHIERNPHDCTPWMRDEIKRLAQQYQFFHWHLAFPQVFRVLPKDDEPENALCGHSGGFDIVLGNPPWERIKLQEKEWFAERCPDIATASHAAQRRRMIAHLATDDPSLYNAFTEARRQAEGESTLIRNTGRYPLCGRGDVNTYAIFAELTRALIAPAGRVGCIVPSGISTDDTT